MGHMFLIVVDAYSKWLEVKMMTSTTTPKTIGCLRELFASYDCPELLVSDNGPQFSSAEFSSFLSSNPSEFDMSDHLRTIHNRMVRPSAVCKRSKAQ